MGHSIISCAASTTRTSVDFEMEFRILNNGRREEHTHEVLIQVLLNLLDFLCSSDEL